MTRLPTYMTIVGLFKIAQSILDAQDSDRIVCLTPQASMADLLQCLESATNKIEKRLVRLTYIANSYPNDTSISMINRCTRVQEKQFANMDNMVPTRTLTNSQFFEAIRYPDMEDGEVEVKFPKLDPTKPFTQSPKQAFHDAVKVIVNKDGSVYDVFAAVAIVAFNRLLTVGPTSLLRMLLLADCKLVFKGGAAIGKFLFQKNPEVWNRLTSAEKTIIFDAFRKGGDNDTGLKFKRVDLPGISDEDQNNEVASIIYDLMIVVKTVISEFGVEEAIKSHLAEPVNELYNINGSVFSVEQRKAKGFTIVEKTADEMVLVPGAEERSSYLFNTVTKVEFQLEDVNGNNQLTQFYLGRVKAGYKFTLQKQSDDDEKYVGLEVNSYAECLDISATLIGSYSAFDDRFGDTPDDDKAKYQRLTTV